MITEKDHWFSLLQSIYAETSNLASGVDCYNSCDGRCCPRKSVSNHTGFIIFLPFEPDYIAHMLNMELTDLEIMWHIQKSQVKTSNGNLIYISWTRDCPFIKQGLCGIYKLRPFDCVSFPVIPILEDGNLRFELGKKCPLVSQTTISFQGKISEVWERLKDELPSDWWNIVRKLVVSNDTLTFEPQTNKKYFGIVD